MISRPGNPEWRPDVHNIGWMVEKQDGKALKHVRQNGDIVETQQPGNNGSLIQPPPRQPSTVNDEASIYSVRT
ncbi:hypothetical protein GCM10022405_22950 [Gibbsiella dentisursi]|uniref:Uncharacterized protein n=1 Tax=Gibbsiella dentisursi TaxID=796890 RepID=A0ABP7LAD8_9GAMM